MQNAHPSPYRPPGTREQLDPHWRSLNVAPYSLVRLKETINPLFPAGTIVALSNEIEVRVVPPTPSKHEGQGAPNPNANASVKIHLWRQNTTTTSVLSRDGGNPLSIQHKHLVDPTTGERKPRGSWTKSTQVQLTVPEADRISYLTDPIITPNVNIPRGVDIPPGTIGVVRKCMTRTNQLITKEQELSSNRVDWWYVLEVDVRVTTWEWVPCRDFVNVLNLEALQPQEVVFHTNFIKSKTGQIQVKVLKTT
ncbi:hypothetical protein GSI_04457 [Ganoderma sinense ZZ0214-1]|uniref:Uncharacterized protein n=1 Tax=Ganoderma sinense ZZ0214-1 TaxID=1077348 RepID=A0A2G8SHH0_9APHY|nr:hypothetical protein GSI_04457 [Ganoderma sinense ZZ0214-1]